MSNVLLRNLSTANLADWLKQSGEKAFRAKQIEEWLWKKGIHEIEEMSNIPSELRNKLSSNFKWDRIKLLSYQEASDKTIKAAFELTDKHIIEGVIIPSNERTTACISTQAGCPVKCIFCATGQMGLQRNLSIGEIYDQVTDLNTLSIEKFQKRLTNIVVMGMGEPLLNYENTIQALNYICSKDGMDWSPQRITLSTVGITEGIEKLIGENLKIQLALSLHSAIQEKREKIIPFAKKYTLNRILESLKKYTQKTQQRVTLEYLMLNEINDRIEDAKALARFSSQVNAKINLIQFNSIDNSTLKQSTQEKTEAFFNYLTERNFIVKIRKSRGIDIDAACGQLANKILKK